MAVHTSHILVRGRGQFPFDMLRYDACYPSTPEAVSNIEISKWDVGRQSNDFRDVRLSKVHEGKDPHWTPDRWSSFGWTMDVKGIWM